MKSKTSEVAIGFGGLFVCGTEDLCCSLRSFRDDEISPSPAVTLCSQAETVSKKQKDYAEKAAAALRQSVEQGYRDVIALAIEQGGPHADEQLLPLVYDEVAELAARELVPLSLTFCL